MEDDDKPIANPFILLREEFDDWAVVFDPDTGHGFGLNPTGVYVWKVLDGEHSIDDPYGRISKGFLPMRANISSHSLRTWRTTGWWVMKERGLMTRGTCCLPATLLD